MSTTSNRLSTMSNEKWINGKIINKATWIFVIKFLVKLITITTNSFWKNSESEKKKLGCSDFSSVILKKGKT